MKIATGQQMKQIDATAIHEFGIPGVVLMEHAALSLLREAETLLCGTLSGKRVAIACGRGNNGGDGFAVARLLALAGARVSIVISCPVDDIAGDACIFFSAVQRMPSVRVLTADDPAAADAIAQAALLIDALFGIGFHGEMGAREKRLVEAINASPAPVLAVDIPSGLAAGSQCLPETVVQADVTVTFTLPKIATMLYPAARACGRVAVAEIGIPASALASVADAPELLAEDGVRALFPKRLPDTHKADFGKAELIAGSEGLTGAAYLCAMGTLVSGCGLVTLNTPACVCPVMEQKLTEVMKHPLSCENGAIAASCAADLLSRAAQADAVLFGPGLGREKAVQSVLEQLLLKLDIPLVIDADGLFALAQNSNILSRAKAPVVLTPHAMEMARLCGKSVEEINENSISVAKAYSMAYHVVVALKGARTVVALPDGQVFVNNTGNSGLSTGGTGDVLAGMVTAFLAQGLPAAHAACAAVYLHGLAADIGVQELGKRAFTAQRLLDFLPQAFLKVLGEE